MKSYFAFFVFFLFSYTCWAQLPTVEFSTYTPRWIHIVQDTNFVPGPNENINSFSSLYPLYNPEVEENFGYVPFLCDNGITDRDGAILVKVQNDNGHIIWSNFLNTSNGDDQNYYTNFIVNDKIYMSGRKRTYRSVELQESWQIGGHSKPFYRVMDKNSGQIEKEIFNIPDSIGELLGFSFKILFPLNQKIIQLERLNHGILLSDLENNSINIVRNQLLPYPERIPAAYQQRTRTTLIRENDQNCLVYFHSVSKDTSIHSHIGRLDYYISNQDSFQLVNSTDFSKYIKTVPFSGIRDRFYHRFSREGDLVITQTYQEEIFPNYRSWLLKLNPKGEVTLYIEELHLADQNHTYEVCIPFYADSLHVFLLGFPSVSNERGLDVLQIDPGGRLLHKGFLTTGGTSKLGIGGIDMNPNGDIIFTFQWEQKYAGLMGMHISDFGINLSAKDEIKSSPFLLMTLSPNPASEEVVIHISDENYHSGNMYIYDLNGQLIARQIIMHGDKFDSSTLLSGTYFVQYNPDNKPGYFLTTKLVKK